MDGIEGLIDVVLGALPLIIAVLAVLLAMATVTRWYRRVGPDKALVVSGGRQPKVITGGGGFVIPFLHTVDTLSLKVMTIKRSDDDVMTQSGIPISVHWISQIQIAPGVENVLTAARAFLGYNEAQIMDIAAQTLTGTFREVVATMDPEEVHREKEAFSKRVIDFATPELTAMGLTIISLNVQDLTDRQGYYQAMGAPRIAAVKRDAKIAEAEANRDADIKAAQAQQAAEQAKAASDTAIAEAEKERDLARARFKRETETERANAEAAHALQKAERDQQLAIREGAVEVTRQEQAALAAEQAIGVETKRKQAEVIVPAQAAKEAAIATADADAYRREKTAEGEAQATRLTAGAVAEQKRVTALADAEGLQATGQAEAQALAAKLDAQAEGERKLAEARAANDLVNLRQFAIEKILEAQIAMVREYAGSMAHVAANVRVVQFAGNGHNGTGGNALFDFMRDVPLVGAELIERVAALTGKDASELIAMATAMIGKEGDGLTAEKEVVSTADEAAETAE
jgi:flotillin